MAYDPRKGIRAKMVFASFTDAARDTSAAPSMTDTKFTGKSMLNFWGAYYGDLALNTIPRYIADLGFDSTGCSETFGTQPYDVVSGTPTATITMTTNTSMSTNTHAGKYIIIKKASGDHVFARIVSNAAGTITVDKNVSAYGVAASDKIALLSVPFGLTMDSFHRIDHIATDFSLEEPTVETEDTFFLGSSDDAGSQNSTIDTNPPTKLVGSITIRGGVMDLLRLKYGTDSTVPTNTIRYNLGSDSNTYKGFTAVWTTNTGDPDGTNETYTGVFCNDIIIKNVGLLNSVSADGRAEATVEFECKASNVRVEKYTAQAYSSGVLI